MAYIVVFIISYLIGCISGAFIVGNIFLNKDISKYGSGNLGTTNAMRVLGKKAGIATLIIDFFKGALVVIIIRKFFGENFIPLGILAAILGHDFPFYRNFKGGKGVATTLGTLAFFNFKLTLVCYLFWLIFTLFTKMVSAGSIAFYISIIIIYSIFSGMSGYNLAIIIAVALLGIYRHKENIKRIRNGNENKIGGIK